MRRLCAKSRWDLQGTGHLGKIGPLVAERARPLRKAVRESLGGSEAGAVLEAEERLAGEEGDWNREEREEKRWVGSGQRRLD